MKPDGVLFIGESENLTKLNSDFELVAPIIYRPTERKR
jgi:chemotaxis methyl-accepting protein methylase